MANHQSIQLDPSATATAKAAPLAPNAELDKVVAPVVTQEQQNQQKQGQSEPPKRPDHIPEKFWKDGKVDEVGLAKSYAELEKKLATQQTPPPKEGEQKKEGEQTPPAKEGEQQQEQVPGEAFKPFTEEYERDGKLSEESYEKLAKAHKVSRTMVDAYIAGLEATRTSMEADILGTVGGRENYAQMATWAKDNLSAGEIAAFNDAVNSGSVETAKLAVAGLSQKFTEAEGKSSQLRLRGQGGGGNTTPFKTTKELTDAMSDPRYASDPEYRAEVAQRVGKSSVL